MKYIENSSKRLTRKSLGRSLEAAGQNASANIVIFSETDAIRGEIQILVKSILYKYDEEIRAEFERRQMDDWAYRIHHTNFGCHNDYHYWDVETQPDAPAANDRTVRE